MSEGGGVLHHTGHFVANPANLITVARIAASPIPFAIILSDRDSGGASWAAFILGWIFAATDLLDGEIARRFNLVSRSGAFLDPLADKIVVLGAMFCLVAVDRYGWIPVALITMREVVITGFRSYWVRKNRAVPARTLGKYKSIVQGLALQAALFPPFQDADTLVSAALWIAVGFTLYSGWLYLMDGSAATRVSGNLNEK
ncbi:MAG: CDP-diacylglycerol--glycerol-3-phosphate 3-phosphatidyltransferase [Acidimicrobiia bacterium]|nr:CDP-diacylglycerol--glycerol-3-phosphate 3-phosphatidyltransferase [Acidimicrobiia bacterium]